MWSLLRTLSVYLLGVCLAFVTPGVAFAQGELTLRAHGPEYLIGDTGERVTATFDCLLTATGSSVDVCGVSFGLDAAPAQFLDIALGGPFDVVDASFAVDEAVEGGVVFAVSLPDGACVPLEPGEDLLVARVTIEALIGDALDDAVLAFVGGLRPRNVFDPLESPVDVVVRTSGGARRTPAVVAAPLTIAPGPFFRRGDANADGRVDIGDASYLFNFLFLGAAPLQCDKAGDANADSHMDIADGVYVLLFNFLGGPPPRDPYPECGPDASGSAVPCDAYNACGSVSLEWQAPQESADGSPLDDLAGYRIYYGANSRDDEAYRYVIDVGARTSYRIRTLPARRVYFAVTAYDLCGNESLFSVEASTLVQPQ